jgi:hypothetical protein
MHFYDKSSDKDIYHTANRMVEFAYLYREPVVVISGNDIIVVNVNDNVSTVTITSNSDIYTVGSSQSPGILQTILETSANQQDDAGL